MRQSVKLVKGTFHHTTSMVGPRHDPYGRDQYEFVGHDGKTIWKMTMCGLMGCSLEIAGMKASSFDCGKEFMDAVKDATGMPLHFWTDRIWEYQQRAMYAKYGPEEYARIQECIAADQALLRYAM